MNTQESYDTTKIAYINGQEGELEIRSDHTLGAREIMTTIGDFTRTQIAETEEEQQALIRDILAKSIEVNTVPGHPKLNEKDLYIYKG